MFQFLALCISIVLHYHSHCFDSKRDSASRTRLPEGEEMDTASPSSSCRSTLQNFVLNLADLKSVA